MKIAFLTDSGTGKSIQEMKDHGIFSLPLQIMIENQNYLDIEECSINDILTNLKKEKVIKTSLPPLGIIEETISHIKEEGYTHIVAVPMSKGLSGTYDAIEMIANQLEMPITMIDTYVAAYVQEHIVLYLKQFTDQGGSLDEALSNIQSTIESCNTILIPDDLSHLKRSGRLTTFAATLASFLKIKPILSLNKSTLGKVDVVDKVRTLSKAMDLAVEKMKKDFVDKSYKVFIAHVDAMESAIILKDKILHVFHDLKVEIIELYAPIAVHTGIGCIGIQYFKPAK